MEAKREESVPVSGFREPQKMGTFLSAGIREVQTTEGPRRYFAIGMEGDVVVDDGHIHYGVFDMELETGEIVQLYDEIEKWFFERDIHVSPFKLADLAKRWDLDPDEFDFAQLAANFKKIDQHDMGKGRHGNRQDGSS